jgi:hypothetical protein
MTHKEFYFWLEGYLHGRLEDEKLEIAPIIEKMNEVKEDNKISIAEPHRIPIPVNPFPVNPPIFPVKDDPYRPPYEVYCGDKQQLND